MQIMCLPQNFSCLNVSWERRGSDKSGTALLCMKTHLKHRLGRIRLAPRILMAGAGTGMQAEEKVKNPADLPLAVRRGQRIDRPAAPGQYDTSRNPYGSELRKGTKCMGRGAGRNPSWPLAQVRVFAHGRRGWDPEPWGGPRPLR